MNLVLLERSYGKPNNLYPQITKVAIGELDKIKILGFDWPTGDGTGIRDYTCNGSCRGTLIGISIY